MTNKKILNAFWGLSNIYFVETSGENILRMFKIPLSYNEQGINKKENSISAPLNIQIISQIQEALTAHVISKPAHINLSLSYKDIIFRSFVIPWMSPNEVKNVVEFEAGKYIPFNLSELSYSFHPISITENGKRKIRVIFTAIKNETLMYYTNIFDRAGVQINIVEPAPLSLIRFLTLKKLMPENETIAVLVKGEFYGKIIVADNSTPQFVREFSLAETISSQQRLDKKILMTRFTNDIKISLDYFNRQEQKLKVKKCFLLSIESSGDLSENLSANINIPVEAVPINTIISSADMEDINYLYAYGIGLVDSVALSANFDLLKKTSRRSAVSSGAIKKGVNFKSIVLTSLICAASIIICFFAAYKSISKPKEKVFKIKSSLSEYENFSENKLKKNKEELINKLNSNKNIRAKSDIGFIIASIPNLLPEQTWINTLDVNYFNSEIQNNSVNSNIKTQGENELTIDLKGYTYLEDKKEQFKEVNNFLKNLQRDTNLSKTFKNIELITTESQKIDNFDVTFFHIKCH